MTHSLMELSPSWEAVNCAATQELPSILRNSKIHRLVQKSHPLVPILSQTNPNYTIPSSFSWSILIFFAHLHLGPPSGLFLSGFSINNLYAFLFSPFRAGGMTIHRKIFTSMNYSYLRKIWNHCIDLTILQPRIVSLYTLPGITEATVRPWASVHKTEGRQVQLLYVGGSEHYT
jgi:hypothetical protein